MKTVTPQQLHQQLQGNPGACLLDVRTPAEHSEVHVPGVHRIPLDQLDAGKLKGLSGFDANQPVYIFCRSGGRAKQAAQQLEKGGFTECHVVEGGTVAWAEAGFPVNRGAAKVIPLERQVRIAAGTIVLTGVLLGYFVHPAFIWLSGFVGAGLIFAGITDWCGMGLLLAKMPWNQRCDTKGCCSAS